MHKERPDRDIGATEIAPIAARVFVMALLGVLFAIAAVEVSTAWRPASAAWRGWGGARGLFAASEQLRESLRGFEDRLREEGWLTRTLLPPLQRFKVERLGLGTESVLIGREGWLHYAPDVSFLSGRQIVKNRARAEAAIRDFASQLADRGIKLVLVPTPAKTAHAPWTLTPRYRYQVKLPELHEWLRSLESDNLYVFPFEVVLQFLQTDSHWTFEMMEWTASSLSIYLRWIMDLPPFEDRFDRDIEYVENIGDLARMLGAGLPDRLRTQQKQRIEVVREGDFAWRPQADSSVLLLGDSFSNIFSQDALGWGSGAGFAEQLSWHLGLPIDRIVQNDAGAWATRDILARELARGRDRLSGKRVVIWQFAARELAHGDWRKISLAVGESPAAGWVSPPPEVAIWTGKIAAVSAMPTPGRVPYADHIAALHVVDLSGDGVEGGEAYAFAWSMTNHQRAAAARLRPGDQVRLRVSDWNAVADRLEGINRSELDGDEFLAADILWAEVLP